MRRRQQWTCLQENREDAWRETALSLMQRFCTMTNGTFIETNGYDPSDYGGEWSMVPSIGPYTWLRTK